MNPIPVDAEFEADRPLNFLLSNTALEAVYTLEARELIDRCHVAWVSLRAQLKNARDDGLLDATVDSEPVIRAQMERKLRVAAAGLERLVIAKALEQRDQALAAFVGDLEVAVADLDARRETIMYIVARRVRP